jgi:predicted ester cyclase
LSYSQNKGFNDKCEQLTSKEKLEVRNTAVVQKYLNGLNKKDTTIYDSLYSEVYSPNCKYYAPSGNPKFLTYDESIKSQKETFRASPDAQWHIEEMFADSNEVIVRLWTVATNTGILNGMPPTGKKAEFSNIVLFKLENGKIIEQREEYDQLGILTQIGFKITPPATAKK